MFTDNFHFSQKRENDSAIKLHNRNRDSGYYYDNLCLYCANNDIDINDISDNELLAAAEIMTFYSAKDLSVDHYYFWIA